MSPIAPFRLLPDYKERVWGGTRLGANDPPYGEAWVVHDRNTIAHGRFEGATVAEIVRAHPVAILGQQVYAAEGAVFPLLIKLLDPADWLSVQVHPDDALAIELEGPGFRGKTEAWYVLEADPGAELIAGIRKSASPDRVVAAMRDGSLEPMLERHSVCAGDALLVEAGLIHALGPGIFIYEVQQSSDLTYRVSDWGRPASAGRALHIDQSIRSTRVELIPDFAPNLKREPNGRFRVLECRYFALDLVDSDGAAIEATTRERSFAAVTIIAGAATLVTADDRLTLELYESAIVPAAVGPYRLEGSVPFCALVSTVP